MDTKSEQEQQKDSLGSLERKNRRLPEFVRKRMASWAKSRHADGRPYDFRVGSKSEPYLLRWYIIRSGCKWWRMSDAEREAFKQENDNGRSDTRAGRNLFVHRFMRSDDDRALHDHPWPWRTIVLEGEYLEYRPKYSDQPSGETVVYHRRAGDIGHRREGTDAHRIELIDGKPALTLFMTGSRARDWGFWCAWGWRHWRDFTARDDEGAVGRGCE